MTLPTREDLDLLEYSDHDFLQPSLPLEPPLPVSPPSATRTNIELNLSVLNRYLPGTESILLIAPYAALYTFQRSSEQWEKASIQGTLFVVRLESPSLGSDRYAIIILNRLGLENFTLVLQPGADVDLEDEIVVVRGGVEDDGMIWGLWIFEEGEGKSTAGMRDEVERVVRSCVEASRVVGGHEGNGTILEEENSSYMHVSPIDSPPRQPENHFAPNSALDPSSTVLQTQSAESQSGRDILGALFHRAMLNYRGP